MRDIFEWNDLGLVPYREAFEFQENLRNKRIAGAIRDRLLLVEHPPVFTFGRRECDEDIRSSRAAIEADGIEMVKTNRGGRITYHGPGQLVGYFICGLDGLSLGVKEFVGAIEDVCIGLLEGYGIAAARDKEHPGLWLGRRKIVAIGLNVSHGVTEHGFALNVDCDMKPYGHIVACGIKDRGVTSIAIETGQKPDMDEVKRRLVDSCGRVLGREFRPYEKVSSSACGVGSSRDGSS